MIDGDVLITAGHLVYDVEKHSYATALEAYIGYTADSSDLEEKDEIKREVRAARTISVHERYQLSGSTSYDFALVKLDRSFDNVQPIPFHGAPKADDQPWYKIVGYPGDMPSETGADVRGHVMHEVEGPGHPYNDLNSEELLKYRLDTFNGEPRLLNSLSRQKAELIATGMSGAPILRRDKNNNYYAIGVHCSGMDWNLGSAIGNMGCIVSAFREALSKSENLPGNHAERVQPVHLAQVEAWKISVDLSGIARLNK